MQDNQTAYKGKLLFHEQVKLNYAHKERCFVEYDDFNCNRSENRLIKATLLYLLPRSSSGRNKKDIKLLFSSFSEVNSSEDWLSDFSKLTQDRNTKDYTTALLWSRVFLTGQSFTSFAGSEIAFALLFPMETLFESYVAAFFKRTLGTAYSVSIQDKAYCLFDQPARRFQLRPDIVVRHKDDDTVFVLDTKWKLLSRSNSNYGISQADMYQMYAYQKKYAAKAVILLYPKTDQVDDDCDIRFLSNDGVSVSVRFIDLFDIGKSMKEITESMNG